MNTEEIYDEKIAPVLLEVARVCTELGIPFVAAVEFEGGESGKGVGKSFSTFELEKCTADIALIYVAARAKGNLDALVVGASKLPHAEGHDSMALFSLGERRKKG